MPRFSSYKSIVIIENSAGEWNKKITQTCNVIKIIVIDYEIILVKDYFINKIVSDCEIISNERKEINSFNIRKIFPFCLYKCLTFQYFSTSFVYSTENV